MSDTFWVAIATIFGNVVTMICGIKLINYRIEQLEKKVEKHNQFYDKVNDLEKSKEVNKVEHSVFNKRIDVLERSVLGE